MKLKYIERLVELGVPREIAVIAAQRADICELARLERKPEDHLIIGMFEWFRTPEGHEIWSGVNLCLRDLLEGAK